MDAEKTITGLTAEGVVKKYFPGFSEILTSINPGEDYTDQIHKFLLDREAYVARELRLFFNKCLVITQPENGEDFDVADEGYDYDPNTFRNWGYIKLRYGPLIEVVKAEIVDPYSGALIHTFNLATVKEYNRSQAINAIPHASYLYGQVGIYLPIIWGIMRSHVPQMFHIDYYAGYETKDKIPRDVLSVIEKLVVINALPIIQNAIKTSRGGFDNLSISMDGVSQSVKFSDFGDTVDRFEKEARTELRNIRNLLRPKVVGYI